ncbi:hypothetical protein RJ640_007058 [Escallonia rubra]|uniref:CCHC-type domain-containing protein n=1 Tax=Escallonia rubra TaxID=112253 RepID=A0AA88RWY8_9ASTE|nr:hypothetical protein RJ640_007058 [Escallonia rubra]
MFRRNPTNQSHQRNNSDWNVRENSDACYECGRTGHIKKYCPQLRNKTANSNSNSRDLKEKKFKSRKALLTWDDSDESDKEGSEDEDVAQLCFMANDDDLKLQNEKELKLVKIRSDHGVRNRHLWLYPPLKRNMLQLEAVVPKFYGCVKPYKILVSL